MHLRVLGRLRPVGMDQQPWLHRVCGPPAVANSSMRECCMAKVLYVSAVHIDRLFDVSAVQISR